MKSYVLTLIALLLGILTGCARSPDRQYYTLRPANSATPSGKLSQPKETIAITALTVPETVDTNKMVTRVTGSPRLEISETHRWAESLPAEIASALADDLSQQYQKALVTTPGQTAAISHADHQLDIDITRFEGTLGVGIDLEAIWTIRGQKEASVRHGHARLSEGANGTDYESLAHAYTAALHRLAILIRNSLEQKS